MIIPNETKNQPSPPSKIVKSRLPSIFLNGVCHKYCQKTDASESSKAVVRAFVRYENAISNLPPLTKQQSDRAWKRIENATNRLLNTLDEVPPEVIANIGFQLFEDEIVRGQKKELKQVSELPMFAEVQFEILQTLSNLLRACRNREENLHSDTSHQPLPLDTPLNNLIRSCHDIWSPHSSNVGIHTNSITGEFEGEFYNFVLTLFEKYFEPSTYQSDLALGQRIKRVLNSKRGKYIG